MASYRRIKEIFNGSTTFPVTDKQGPIHRQNSYPLDTTEVFESLEKAQQYAQDEIESTIQDAGLAYVGQKITVVNESAKTADTYMISDGDGTLTKFAVKTANGKIPVADLPIATSTTVGVVKPDGTTTSVNASGQITVIGGGGSAGVTSVTTGDNNGTIKVVTDGTATNVAVKGLGTNAYTSTAFAPLASPSLTGTPKAPTAAKNTNTTQIATTAFVVTEIDDKIATADAMIYKGSIAGGSTGAYGALTNAASRGWTYKVSTAGKINGKVVEVGDMLICNTDSTAAATSSNYTTIAANWDIIQGNIDGAVIGPASSVDARVAVFNGTTGKVIKDSGYTIASSVPSNAKFTDTTYSAATTSTAGLMSAADKSKLDGIATGATKITVDTALSSTSTNPVQNKVINDALAAKASTSAASQTVAGLMSAADKAKLDGIATGATKVTVDTALSSTSTNPVQNKVINDALAAKASTSAASTSTAGLMSAADKSKLDGIAANANNYTHPSYTSRSSGFYKVTVDGTGHVSGVTTVAKSDITALGIPGSDTTYSNATQSYSGLMSSTDKTKLDGIAAGANAYTLPEATSSTLGGVKVGTGLTVSSGVLSVDSSNGIPTGVIQSGRYTSAGILYTSTSRYWANVTMNANGSGGSVSNIKVNGNIVAQYKHTHDGTDTVTYSGPATGALQVTCGSGSINGCWSVHTLA